MLRKRVSLCNGQIWVEPSCREVICWCSGISLSACHRAWASFCRSSGIVLSECQILKYYQWRHTGWSNCWCSGIAFSPCRTLRHEHSHRAGMSFVDAHESGFPVAKYSGMSSSFMLGCWLENAQNKRFHPAKGSDISRYLIPWCHLMMLWNGVFMLPYAQIWVVQSCGKLDLLILRNRVFILPNAQIMGSSVMQVRRFLKHMNRFFRLKNTHICEERSCKGDICWCSGIAYTGCQMCRFG